VVRLRGALSLPLWRVAGTATVSFSETSMRGLRSLRFVELDGSSPAGALDGAWHVSEPAVGAPFCDLGYEAELRPRPGRVPLPTATVRRLLAEAAGGALRAVADAAEASAAAAAGPARLEVPRLSDTTAATSAVTRSACIAAAAAAAAGDTGAELAGAAVAASRVAMWSATAAAVG
jgi:hypothetical protein